MHETQIIETRVAADGAIAVCIRCCGDPATDSWHTETDLENVETKLADAHRRVAELHQQRNTAHEKVRRMEKQKVQHNFSFRN